MKRRSKQPANLGADREAAIKLIFLGACEDELLALKPGNVHIHAPGHRMTVEDFRAAAAAAAPLIAAAGLRVGERVRRAVAASLGAAGQNINLGIILLAAPLAEATSQGWGAGSLPERLRQTLVSLDESDAANIFAAIAEANPGGLGTPAAGDVRTSPKLGLLEAMALAAPRDRVARAYVTGFEDIFEFGLGHWDAGLTKGHARPDMVSNLFLAFLSAFPDSHIGRKYGPDAAEAVRAEAASLQTALRTAKSAKRTGLLLDFDRRLKARGLNPGTGADLTVATLFAAGLLKIEENGSAR